MKHIPDLREKRFPEKHTIAISPEMKELLTELKEVHRKDVNSWIRELIKDGLDQYLSKDISEVS